MRDKLELNSLDSFLIRYREQLLELMLSRAKRAKVEGFDKHKKILQNFGQVSLQLKKVINS